MLDVEFGAEVFEFFFNELPAVISDTNGRQAKSANYGFSHEFSRLHLGDWATSLATIHLVK